MGKIICINQSNYLPWRGYFDLIRKSDEFIIYDHVQYTHHDWRNRNRIKTPNGLLWLTVPVEHSGRLTRHQKIDETKVSDQRWATRHLKNFRHFYRKAPYFDIVMNWLEPIYTDILEEPLLSDINVRLLQETCSWLGIPARLLRCTDVIAGSELDQMDRTARIIRLCQMVGASHYLSGPAAKAYLDVCAMAEVGIEVEWMNYGGYATYPQLWGDFEPSVSIIDLLFCMGKKAGEYIGK